MTRRVYVCGPGIGTVEGNARLLTLAGYAIVRGYDPVVVGLDLDAAAAIGAGGGEFWAIEVDPPAVYTPEVSRAYREWEAETAPGAALRLRKSKLWHLWQQEIMQYGASAPVAPAPVLGTSDNDIPF